MNQEQFTRNALRENRPWDKLWENRPWDKLWENRPWDKLWENRPWDTLRENRPWDKLKHVPTHRMYLIERSMKICSEHIINTY